jgi:hypothetical protein
MSKKLTAVEWLVLKLNQEGYAPVVTQEEYNQAKAMEKEQIEDAYQLGFEDGDSNVSIYVDKKEYYNQTYGGDKCG